LNYLTDLKDLKYNEGICGLYFYMTWMPFHNKMIGMIEKIEQKYGAKFFAIDVYYFKNMSRRFNIESVPTMLIYKDNVEVQKIVGAVLFSAFKSVFENIKE
jgi:thiol-disulfide isomerase/thioredoxin